MNRVLEVVSGVAWRLRRAHFLSPFMPLNQPDRSMCSFRLSVVQGALVALVAVRDGVWATEHRMVSA